MHPPGQSSAASRARGLRLIGLLGLVLAALLPWWRNHAYLRDLYDYGLVMAAIGRIGHGQLPYLDFATPIQAGFLGLSVLVEKIGGGTYLGLTVGGAALITFMVAGLWGVLVRVWPVWVVAPVVLAVTAASACQHTILWHNSLGVYCLGLVVWSAALAPVLAAKDWGRHAVVAAGLLVGGLNKLNFQLVALAAALAWAGRAGLLGRAGWWRVGLTCLVWLLAGTVLPLVLELTWTGASWAGWRENVIGLAAAGRAGQMMEILDWKFLLKPLHDYYGPLLLPQVGLVGVVLSGAALLGCWPRRSAGAAWPLDRVLLPAAVGLVGAAGVALLATNQEIAYVGLGAWLVLVVGLWLGWAPERTGLVFRAGLLLPAAGLAVVAWLSAWAGQRSQFGYSNTARAEYHEAGGASLGYLAGLHLPPDLAHSISLLEPALPPPDRDGRRGVFYGTGMEWAERCFPALHETGRPLWVHWGTTYGPEQTRRLMQALDTDRRYQVVLTTLARDFWPPLLAITLRQRYDHNLLGRVMVRWTRNDNRADTISDSIDFVNYCGKNVAGVVLQPLAEPLRLLPYEETGLMLGTEAKSGRLRLAAPTNTFGAEAVMELLAGSAGQSLAADFRVRIAGEPAGAILWQSRLELRAGEARVAVPFLIHPAGREVEMEVGLPDESAGQLAAGYRNLEISHAIEGPAVPPRLRPDGLGDEASTPEHAVQLLGAVTWRPADLVVRGGQPAATGLELRPGGEVWLRSENMQGEIRGQLSCVDQGRAGPMVRVVWYKGGRLQIFQQGTVDPGRPMDFHAWCAEPGGWFGILLDPTNGRSPVRVKVTEASVTP